LLRVINTTSSPRGRRFHEPCQREGPNVTLTPGKTKFFLKTVGKKTKDSWGQKKNRSDRLQGDKKTGLRAVNAGEGAN